MRMYKERWQHSSLFSMPLLMGTANLRFNCKDGCMIQWCVLGNALSTNFFKLICTNLSNNRPQRVVWINFSFAYVRVQLLHAIVNNNNKSQHLEILQQSLNVYLRNVLEWKKRHFVLCLILTSKPMHPCLKVHLATYGQFYTSREKKNVC